MKVAILGSGASAIAVLHALQKWAPKLEVTVFDIGARLDKAMSTSLHPSNWTPDYFKELYLKIKADHGLRFPPPKTHFGESLPRYLVGKSERIFRSELRGGLTNFWGGTMLPFVEKDLIKWPFKVETLHPYYKEIADLVGISGRRDALNQYFPEEFSNRPPLRPTNVLAKLDKTVNSHRSDGDYDVISGINRLCLETREGYANTCVYCGECMSGCFAGAIYNAKNTLDLYVKSHFLKNYILGKVLSVDPHDRSILLHTKHGNVRYRGFSKVFVCAGCAGTTEIVIRSMNLGKSNKMVDNAVYVFPIMYLGKLDIKAFDEPYFALSNLIFGCVPRKPGLHFAQVQVYPTFDYLLRYYLPFGLWSYFKSVATSLRARLFWGRLYVHSNESQAYSFSINCQGQPVLDIAHGVGDRTTVHNIIKSIRNCVNRDGFYLPPVPPILQKTSSHYASTLPYGGHLIEVKPNGEVMPGVYICDSSCFPESPAVSPTFTIMANACRTAREAVDD